MIFNILDNTSTELWMAKYIIGEIFSSGGATLYKNPSDQTVEYISLPGPYVLSKENMVSGGDVFNPLLLLCPFK